MGAPEPVGAADGEKELKIHDDNRRSCFWRMFFCLAAVLLVICVGMSLVLHMPGLLGVYGHSAQQYLHDVSARAGFPLENITKKALERVRALI